MTHTEAIAIKAYYEIMQHAAQEDIHLGYMAEEKVEYYKNSMLTIKQYKFIKEYLNENEHFLIDIISQYLTKIHEVATDKVRID